MSRAESVSKCVCICYTFGSEYVAESKPTSLKMSEDLRGSIKYCCFLLIF